VLDTFAVLLDVLGDGAFLGSGFEEFDIDFTDLQKGGTHLLRRDFFNQLALDTEHLFPQGNGFVQAFYGDSKVVDLLDHGDSSLSLF
jgi:hypothetical protein